MLGAGTITIVAPSSPRRPRSASTAPATTMPSGRSSRPSPSRSRSRPCSALRRRRCPPRWSRTGGRGEQAGGESTNNSARRHNHGSLCRSDCQLLADGRAPGNCRGASHQRAERREGPGRPRAFRDRECGERTGTTSPSSRSNCCPLLEQLLRRTDRAGSAPPASHGAQRQFGSTLPSVLLGKTLASEGVPSRSGISPGVKHGTGRDN
jgi:hypothetical protein